MPCEPSENISMLLVTLEAKNGRLEKLASKLYDGSWPKVSIMSVCYLVPQFFCYANGSIVVIQLMRNGNVANQSGYSKLSIKVA